MRFCMDWRSVKFDWNRVRAFLVTAEEGSFSAAARALGMAQPTLGRQVGALEEELGVVLFERVGRGLTLTQSGLELVEHARAMADAAASVSLTASGQSQAIEGTVRITATEVTSAFILPAIVTKLRSAQPAIEVEILATNAVRDLRRREADIAIRAVRPTDPDLIARKLMIDTAELYASEAYLRRVGELSSPEKLSCAEFVGFNENEPFLDGLNARGLTLSARNFPVLCGQHLVQWELVKQGAGVGVMISRVGDAEPLVRRAAPWFPPFEFEVWLVAHRELNTSRRLRIVFDWLTEEFRHLQRYSPSSTSIRQSE
ncbi:transcriptional regulator, LysR family protein [alpha proteobacterium BAL199]|jgi:DNA-binding transcriptional LysR family regulator|nr:transcriptional regulator, LysR family protein [alpha proteobacterium BAL199]